MEDREYRKSMGKNNDDGGRQGEKNSMSMRNIHEKQIMSSTNKFKTSREENIRKMEELINNVIMNKAGLGSDQDDYV